MFTRPKFYDLNIRSEAQRKQEMAHTQKNIKDSSNAPTIIPQYKIFSQNPQMGTPAYVLSLKQRQQQINYTFKYGEGM
jgi:hypothetical protein